LAQARPAKRGARMWWWLVTAALALMVWIYCLFMLDPAMLP
jgi:predicted nucleic acid-binding Zn ribbon protein